MSNLPQLPETPHLAVRCEADYYGASRLIAAELGLLHAPVSQSTWVHGCDMFPMPRAVFSPASDTPEQTHLVANLKAQQWWRDNGFHRAVAVGCPFIYTKPSGMARMPGSVLAMPNHCLPGSSRDREHVENWLSVVERLRPTVTSVTVCLHEDDVAELAPLVEKAGLSWVPGARHDTLSLPRMRALFEQFEFMITDVQGSHLPYAAWCGCKVAFLEPLYVRKWEYMANHPHFQKYPRLKQNLVFHEPENIRSRLPFLFVDHLSQAQCPLAWAEELLGVSSKRTPQEMARLMGWKWSPEEPAFAGIPYEEVASWLGAVSPDHEILSRDQQIVKLKEQNDGLKGELKEVQAELRKTTKQQQRQDAFVRSLSGRMARGFYSVEKRVRSLFGGL